MLFSIFYLGFGLLTHHFKQGATCTVHNCCHVSKSRQGAGLRNTETKMKKARLTSRAGGEHRTHGDVAGPEDLVCTRSSGGGRRGGGDFRIGDALMLSNPNKRARKAKNPNQRVKFRKRLCFDKKLLTNRIDAIRRDLKMYKYKGGGSFTKCHFLPPDRYT